MAYKSIHTGAQIDAAVSAVIEKQAVWDSTDSIVKAALLAANWTNNRQTVTINGVDKNADSQFIEVSPAASSLSDCAAAIINPVAQSADSITFECKNVPAADIDIIVRIRPAN